MQRNAPWLIAVLVVVVYVVVSGSLACARVWPPDGFTLLMVAVWVAAGSAYIAARCLARARPAFSVRTFLPVILSGMLVLPVAAGYNGLRYLRAELIARKQMLLTGINHEKLLRACREVLRNPERYPSYVADDSGSSDLDPNDPMLPEIIRGLHAAHIIVVDNARMNIALGAGFDSYGVVAYAEGEHATGYWELTPGLYYYEPERMPGVRYPPGFPAQ